MRRLALSRRPAKGLGNSEEGDVVGRVARPLTARLALSVVMMGCTVGGGLAINTGGVSAAATDAKASGATDRPGWSVEAVMVGIDPVTGWPRGVAATPQAATPHRGAWAGQGFRRAGCYSLLRVRVPVSDDPRVVIHRIGLRSHDEALGLEGPPDPTNPLSGGPPEFLGEPSPPTAGQLSVVVPAILFGDGRRVSVTLYDQRGGVLDRAVVDLASAMPATDDATRVVAVVADNPTEVLGLLASVGLTVPEGWAVVHVGPGDLPENLAGLDGVQAVVVEASAYLRRGGRRQSRLPQWALDKATPATLRAWGSPLLLIDSNGAATSRQAGLWQRHPRVGPATPIWVPSNPAVAGGDLALGLASDGRHLPGPTWANRPAVSAPERAAVMVGALAVTAAAALVGLIFSGAGRAMLGLGGLTVVAATAWGVVLWRMPARAVARVDVWQLVEAAPAAPLDTTPTVGRVVTVMGVAAARTDEVLIATQQFGGVVGPVCPSVSLQAAMPVRFELLHDAETEVTVRPTPTLEVTDRAGPLTGGPHRTWRRVMPIWTVFAAGTTQVGLPLAMTPAADSSTGRLTLTTGAAWPWPLVEAFVLDVREPLRSGRPSLAARLADHKLSPAARTLRELSDPRVVPVGNLAGGGSVTLELYGSGSRTLADHLALHHADTPLVRYRKAALRAVLEDDGQLRIKSPCLIGWAELAPLPVSETSPRTTINTLGRLVVVPLDHVWR